MLRKIGPLLGKATCNSLQHENKFWTPEKPKLSTFPQDFVAWSKLIKCVKMHEKNVVAIGVRHVLAGNGTTCWSPRVVLNRCEQGSTCKWSANEDNYIEVQNGKWVLSSFYNGIRLLPGSACGVANGRLFHPCLAGNPPITF